MPDPADLDRHLSELHARPGFAERRPCPEAVAWAVATRAAEAHADDHATDGYLSHPMAVAHRHRPDGSPEAVGAGDTPEPVAGALGAPEGPIRASEDRCSACRGTGRAKVCADRSDGHWHGVGACVGPGHRPPPCERCGGSGEEAAPGLALGLPRSEPAP